jgi:hypothetical protein
MAIKVEDEFRKNELSVEPGGTEITVVYRTGNTVIYDKVKNINAYCNKIRKDPNAIEIWIDNKLNWKR